MASLPVAQDFGAFNLLFWDGAAHFASNHPQARRRPLARALRRAYADEGLAAAEVHSRVAAILAAPIALAVANAVLARHDAAVPFFLDAGTIPDAPGLPRGLCRSFCGSPFYIAPEMLATAAVRPASSLAHGYNAYAVDVWALGVLLHEMAVGTPPFPGRTADEVVAHLKAR